MTEEEKRVLFQLIDQEMCNCHDSWHSEKSGRYSHGKPDQDLLDMWRSRWETLNSVSKQLGGRDYGTIAPWRERL